MPIDTLKAAKRLQQEDTFSPEQAERIAEVLSDLDVASATKDDLDNVEERLNARIDELAERLDNVEEQLNTRIDNVEKRLNTRIDNVEKQLKTRIDEVEEQLNTRIEEVEARLTQRIELSEQRTKQQISQLRSDLYRVLLLGFGGVAALVTVLNYVIG